MKTLERNIETIKNSAKSAVSKERVWREGYTVGQGKDQGDLLMWVTDVDVSTFEEVNGDFLQLAPGSTQGSRHTVSLQSCRAYKGPNFGEFINRGTRENPKGYIDGYVLVTIEECLIAHPEHPCHIIPPGYVIQTAGQVDARTLQWAKD